MHSTMHTHTALSRAVPRTSSNERGRFLESGRLGRFRATKKLTRSLKPRAAEHVGAVAGVATGVAEGKKAGKKAGKAAAKGGGREGKGDGEGSGEGYSRRMVLALGISAGLTAAMGLTPPPSKAAAAAVAERGSAGAGGGGSGASATGGSVGVGEGEGVSVGQRILRGLGFGDADVYYPRVFEGEWECLSQLIAVDTPQGEQAVDSRAVAQARRDVGVTLPYRARFFDFNGRVVGDRAFTTTSLVEATVGKGVVADADWSPSRPNQLSLTLKGGYKVQSVITRRSYEMSSPNQFDVFEYSQQVFDNPTVLDGPPSVKASSNLTRYQWDEEDKTTGQVKEIVAFQRVSMFPVVGGLAGDSQSRLTAAEVISLGFGDKPVTVYKYLLRLTRVA
ncbi:hypothetical protein CLOP_g23203 [Closterium sp. NIES-67]|nr:hypothetical protein CLOP_g23203 [Closterium sp. NIES-67]